LSWSSGRLAAAAAAAGCGWIVALAAPRDVPVGSYGDDARYVVLARALREQGRFRLLQVPGEPAETMFPPGFPAVLALAWSPAQSGTANLERLRWVNLALVGPLAAALCLAGTQLLALPAAASAALAVAGVAAPIVMARWMLPLSEPLCLILVAAALLLLAGGEEGRRRTAGVLVLVLAAYVRTVAVAFLAGAVLVEWRRGQRKRAIVDAAIAAAALAPWAAWTVAHGAAVAPPLYGMFGSYAQWYGASVSADWMATLVLAPATNAWLLLQSLGDAVTGYLPVGAVASAAIGAAVVAAIWAARRAAPAAVAGLACYALIVLAWPYPPFRFVGAVWPLALLAAAAGARVLSARAVWAVAAAALTLAAVAFVRGAGARAAGTEDWRPLAAAVRPQLPPGAVLASSNPALYYLSLGVQGVPNERMRSYRFYRQGFWSTAWGLGDDVWAIVRRYRPTHLLVERRGVEGRYAVGSLMRQCPDVLRELWRSQRGEYLYAVRSDAPCAPQVTKR
jgi:hypothetical protein